MAQSNLDACFQLLLCCFIADTLTRPRYVVGQPVIIGDSANNATVPDTAAARGDAPFLACSSMSRDTDPLAGVRERL